jgi:hypothetical protein
MHVQPGKPTLLSLSQRGPGIKPNSAEQRSCVCGEDDVDEHPEDQQDADPDPGPRSCPAVGREHVQGDDHPGEEAPFR